MNIPANTENATKTTKDEFADYMKAAWYFNSCKWGSNQVFLSKRSDLHYKDPDVLKASMDLLKENPKAKLPTVWILPVPEQLEFLASEVYDLLGDEDMEEADFGEDLLSTLAQEEHERSSPVQVIKDMLPKIICKVADGWDLRDFYENYRDGEEINEVAEELISDPAGFPPSIKLVIEKLDKIFPKHHKYCIDRDAMIMQHDAEY